MGAGGQANFFVVFFPKICETKCHLMFVFLDVLVFEGYVFGEGKHCLRWVV